jgi:hypothetical protein
LVDSSVLERLEVATADAEVARGAAAAAADAAASAEARLRELSEQLQAAQLALAEARSSGNNNGAHVTSHAANGLVSSSLAMVARSEEESAGGSVLAAALDRLAALPVDRLEVVAEGDGRPPTSAAIAARALAEVRAASHGRAARKLPAGVLDLPASLRAPLMQLSAWLPAKNGRNNAISPLEMAAEQQVQAVAGVHDLITALEAQHGATLRQFAALQVGLAWRCTAHQTRNTYASIHPPQTAIAIACDMLACCALPPMQTSQLTQCIAQRSASTCVVDVSWIEDIHRGIMQTMGFAGRFGTCIRTCIH